MEQKVYNKKKIVRIVIWAVVILAIIATIHIAVNSFDMLGFLQKLHGG